MAIVKDLGMVTAYAYAVAGGYEGTEEEFTELLGQAGVTLEQLENLSAVAVTLAPGSEATASYSDGVLTFGIPQGATGETGQTGPQGPEGPTGNGIASIAKTGTSGLVDTYTITFTDGTTTTFAVTNGADGDITNVAEAFDTTKAYSVGDMVLYQGTLYAFTAAHPAGAWVGSDAQAVILADEVTELKSDFSRISGVTKNLFNPDWLLEPTGWTNNGDEYYGTAQAIYNKYKPTAAAFPFGTFKDNTQYTFSFKAKVTGSVTSSQCFRIVITYTDTTSVAIAGVPNNTETYTRFSAATAAGKTVSKVNVSYGNGLENTLYLKDFQCEEGATATEFIPYVTATDYVARQMVEEYTNDTIEKIIGPSDGYTYTGERITLGGYKYKLDNKHIRVGQGQDCVELDGKVFAFSSEGTCKISDITTGTMIETIVIPDIDGVTPHFNTVVFGDTVEGNEIPLLYANVNIPLSDDPGLCAVYQLAYENSSWSITLVHTINVSFVGDENWGTLGRYDAIGFVVDNGKFYAYGSSSGKHKSYVYGFAIPLHSAEAVLTRADVIAEFEVPYMYCPQGCMVYDSKLYIVEGLGKTNSGTSALYVIDLITGNLVSYINTTDTLTGEPEFIFVYNESIILGALDLVELLT